MWIDYLLRNLFQRTNPHSRKKKGFNVPGRQAHTTKEDKENCSHISEAKPHRHQRCRTHSIPRTSLRSPVHGYVTPAHLRSTLPEGLKERHGGVVRSACLSEASCVEDSDHGASFVVRNIRAAGSFFRLLLLAGPRRSRHRA